jgi:hypothetical protein
LPSKADIFFLCHQQIDEDILANVIALGFDRTQLLDSLLNRKQNKVFVLLSLVVGNNKLCLTKYVS